MKTLTTIACLFLMFFATSFTTPTPKAKKQAKKGWTQLFDGKTLKGWHIYRGEATGESWQVEDGAIVFNPINKPGVKPEET